MTRIGDCPDPETLAALVEGRLPRSEAGPVRAHVADCEACFEIVRETLHFLSEEAAGAGARQGASRSLRRFGRAAVPWLGAAAALLVLGSGVLFLLNRREDGPARLVAAVGERRLVEARLTGGFLYAPLESPRRGPETLDRADPDDWKVFEAAARIHEEARGGRASPEDTHALGLAHLLLGNAEDAVLTLETAHRATPGDARVLSDLAAAYIARADRAGRAEDVVRAIDAARHSIALDPYGVEARFNLALALEKQVAPGVSGSTADQGRAIEAWEEYLRHDADSSWAEEARRRVAELRGRSEGGLVPPDPDDVESAARRGEPEGLVRLARQSPRVAREVLERRLLPAWAEGRRDGRRDAAGEALTAALTLAEAIERASGDRLGVETVRGIEEVSPAGEASRRLAEGVLQYRRALVLHDAGDLEKAAGGFRAAVEALDRARSPLRWTAALYLAICDYYGGRGSGARRDVDLLGERIAGRPYPALLARVRWMQGLLRAVGGDLSQSLDLYEEALALFQRAGELDGVASAQFLIAENLDLLGDREEGWRRRATALALASRTDADRRRAIHLEATFAALDRGLPWAALVFHEPLFAPWSAGDPASRSETYQMRARILAETGDPGAALTDLAAAEQALEGVGDPGLRRRLAAELGESRGSLLLGRDPEAAVAPLQEAHEYFTSVGATSRLPALHLGLGRAHEALGSFTAAQSDYTRGIEVLEGTQAGLLREPHRVSFLDHTWKLFDAAIRLEAGRLESPDNAFAFAERARRAELLAPGECAGAPVSAAGAPGAGAVARELPRGVTVVYFVLVPERLLRWVFRDGRLEFRPQSTTTEEVEGMVREVHRAAAAGDQKAFRAASAALYDLLLRPVEALLPDAGELWIVPDRRLDDVPYAALLDRDGDRYLVERFATGIAPAAASLLARCGPRGHPTTEARVLVVGNPAFDGARHRDLDPLPDAEEEAREVASLYPDSTLLVGATATPGRFLAGLAGAEIVHFAGHSLVNDRYPLLSALVLAPDHAAGHPGLLMALDMQQAAISRARLVVLGACRATGGGTERPGGAFSLARPFLAAGVPEIVGTLWSVRDRQARTFLVSFHREYRRGLTAVQGLRAAQLAALRGQDQGARSPLSWGAFVVNATTLR